MRSEKTIRNILESFNESIIPSAADWVFPEHDLEVSFDEVCATIKVLRWVLDEKKKKKCSFGYHVSLYERGYLECPNCGKAIEK